MAKTIGTILSLTDKVSPKLITIGRNLDSLDKKQQAMAKSAAYQLNNYANSLGSAATAAAKFAGASALALGGVAIKTGLSEAMGLETYRTQLLTATKDTERAAEVMRYAISLANQTPFEGADMTSAAAVLEMAGMQTEKYLTLLGDVAAATNREIADVRHGFINAFTVGEYASFREVTGMALNGEMIDEYGRARGITDRAEALYALLNEKFGGGMAALAKTTKGTWATITDVTKNSLANIIGATNDGTVRAGSALDTLKTKATGFADTLVRMQNDGTLDAWSEKIDTGFGKAWRGAERLWKLLSDNKEVVVGLGGAALAVNVLGKGIVSLNATLTATKNLLAMIGSGAIGLTAAGTAVAIGAVAAGEILALRHVQNKMRINNNLAEAVPDYDPNYHPERMDGVNIVERNDAGELSTPQSAERAAAVYDDRYSSGLAYNNVRIVEKTPTNALGTRFFRGGRSLVGEFGPELVELPVGARIYPHNETRQILQQTTNETQQFTSHSRTTNHSTQTINRGRNTITIHFTINGAGDPDQVADMVCGKILEVLDNV